MKVITRIKNAVKELARDPRDGWFQNNDRSSRRFNGQRNELTSSKNSSIVDACLYALITGVNSTQPRVMRPGSGKDAEPTEVVDHELAKWVTPEFMASLIRNGVYSGNSIAKIKEDTATLSVNGLTIFPSSRIKVERTGGLIDGSNIYQVKELNNKYDRYTEEEIFHYKYLIDPDRSWIGISPLKNVDKDMLLDQRVITYTSGFMKRFGIPGWMVTPKPGQSFQENDRQTIREDVEENYIGENAGGVSVAPVAADVMQLQGPKNMIDVNDIRSGPEYRVCAQLGVPPVLAGLKSGYDKIGENATVVELRKQFADNTLQPLLLSIAAEITKQILHRMPGGDQLYFEFDTSESYIFQRDLTTDFRHQNAGREILTINERRAIVGYDTIPDGDVIVSDSPVESEVDEELNDINVPVTLSDIADE